ncbi:MAG: hypothetical protein SO434_03335 [Eubacteriales bacterium]|nr:hypothetical protein [Eubacteriales bacterium]
MEAQVVISIIIPIISAIIGGGLTLVGVIITIKHSDKINKKEYIEKFQPVLRAHSDYDDYDYKHTKIVRIENDSENKEKQIFGIFSNTDKANVELDSILINDNCYKFTVNRYIKKSEDFIIDVSIDSKILVETLKIKVLDDCNNSYIFNLMFNTISKDTIRILGIKRAVNAWM